MPKVAFVMPCGGNVEPRAVQSALSVVAGAVAKGIDLAHIGITDRTLIHTARNWMSNEFLASNSEWVFWMDSDMILEYRTIPVLLSWAEKLNAKMLTGIYCQRMGEHRPLIFVKSVSSVSGPSSAVVREDDEYGAIPIAPENWNIPPFQVDAAGFGCMLIHRDAYKGMEYPFFQFLTREKKLGNGDSYISEDIYFCREARKRNVAIWAVPELKCGHIGQAPVITRDDFKPDTSKVDRVLINSK